MLARAAGRSGELVLRRRGADLEVIADGVFLMSSANAASSRALVDAGVAVVAGAPAGAASGQAHGHGRARGRRPGLRVLVAGLGLGYALDAALVESRVAHVTVVEYEPQVVAWFRTWGEERARRLAAAEAVGRARVLVSDALEVLRAAATGGEGRFDLIALDTDNGPGWLVREANAGLYDAAGVALAHAALRHGGAAVFWSPEPHPCFAARLAAVFARVEEVAADDRVGGRTHRCTMYLARRG